MTESLLDSLRSLDRAVLLAINGCHNPVLDDFFLAVTNRWFWVPAYVVLAWYLFRVLGKNLIWFFLAVFITVLLTDQIASSLLKPLVHRLRPCHVSELQPKLHLLEGICGGSYGFVSSHAANTFGLFSLLFFLSGRRWYWLTFTLVVWATTVSFSRIYLAVHYPADIICGALIGLTTGWMVSTSFRRGDQLSVLSTSKS